MVEAAVVPVSLDNIVRLVQEAFQSSEYVRDVVNRASVRAREVLERLAPERKARRAVGDEIFLGERPMLVVAEPSSLAVLRVSVEAHRDEKTWAKILQPLDGIEIFASDLGKGMTAAVEARGWPHQADIFHAVRILTESWAVEERRAYEAIDEEYAWERRLQKLRDQGEDPRGVATNHALARRKTQRALERFEEIERLVRQMRSAVELTDASGRRVHGSSHRCVIVDPIVEPFDLLLEQIRCLGQDPHQLDDRVMNFPALEVRPSQVAG